MGKSQTLDKHNEDLDREDIDQRRLLPETTDKCVIEHVVLLNTSQDSSVEDNATETRATTVS